MTTTTSFKNVNLLNKAQFDAISSPAADELWAVETPVVVETYRNGTSWYRIYSDGWIEQGGKIVINSASVSGGTYNHTTLKFIKPFSNLMSWYCQAKHDRFNAGFAFDNVGSAASSVDIYQVNDSTGSFSNPFVIWYACGYKA